MSWNDNYNFPQKVYSSTFSQNNLKYCQAEVIEQKKAIHAHPIPTSRKGQPNKDSFTSKQVRAISRNNVLNFPIKSTGIEKP